VKRREAKRKGEKKRYKHLNAEFQRIARRDKKAFLSNQCKEIEENNRMGKTRDLFKKIRDTKGTFHAKMGSIKDRYVIDLIEAEDIQKRWQEYTEELYKRIKLNKLEWGKKFPKTNASKNKYAQLYFKQGGKTNTCNNILIVYFQLKRIKMECRQLLKIF